MRHIGWMAIADNLARQAAIDATELSDAAAYPLRHLVELPTSRPTRLRNVYTPTVYLTFPGPVDVDTAAIAGHNLSKSAKVDVTGSTTWGGSDWHEEATVSEDMVLLHLTAAQTYQYWRITFTDPANDYGFIQLGYLMMGEMTVPGYSVAPEWELSDEPVRVEIETAAGATGYRYIAERRRVYVTLDGLTAAQMETLRSMWLEAARREEPVLFAPDVEGGTAVFGAPVGDGLMSSVITPDWRSATVEVVSDARGPILLEPLPALRAGEPLPAGWTFSRGSTAYYKNRDLLLVEAAVDECRTAHYVLPGRPVVLLEDESTNLLTYSEEFDNSAWSKVGVSVTANAADEPVLSPSKLMDKVVEDTSTGSHRIQQSVTVSDSAELSLSVYAKAGERNLLLVKFIDGPGSNFCSAKLDLVNGTVSNKVGAGGNTIYGAYIEPMGGGVYRCCVFGKMASGITTVYTQFVLLDANGNSSYTGDGTSGLYLWGAQLEEKCAPTSYIKTTSTTASRSIDSLTRTISIPMQPITRYVKMIEMGEAFGSGLGGVSRFTTALGGYFSSAIGLSSSKVVRTSTQDVLGGQYINAELNIDSIQPLNTLEFRSSLLPDRRVSTEVSINGGASASQTGSIGPQFSYNYVWNQLEVFNSGVKRRPLLAIERLVHARGVHSIEEMRRR